MIIVFVSTTNYLHMSNKTILLLDDFIDCMMVLIVSLLNKSS